MAINKFGVIGALEFLFNETRDALYQSKRGKSVPSKEQAGAILLAAATIVEQLGYDAHSCMSLAAVEMGVPVELLTEEFDNEEA